MEYMNSANNQSRIKVRLILDKIAKIITVGVTFFSVIVLAILLYRVFSEGLPVINRTFLTGRLSTDPTSAGIFGAILGTFWLIVVITPITMLFGIGTAIYIELYMKEGKLRSLLAMYIANLAGVPSIVYVILGLTIFVSGMYLGNVV